MILGRSAFFMLLVFASSTVAARARPWLPSDEIRVGIIDTVEAVPGGKVLFDIVRANPKSDTWTTKYMLLDANGATRALSFGGANVQEVHWSPSGRAIAFTAPDKKGAIQLYRSDSVGEHTHALTSGSRSIRQFAWSPDGSRIAAIETLDAKRVKPPLSFWFDPNSDVLAGAPPARELWIIDVRTGASRRIVTDRFSYGGPQTDHDPGWSADGRHVAVVRQPSALSADFERAQAVSVDVRTGGVQPLTRPRDFALPDSAAPAYSVAGSHVATVHTWDGTFAAREDVFVDGRDVSAGLDRDFWSCAGSRTAWDGNTVLATAMDGVAMRLYRFAPNAAPVAITPKDGSVEAFAATKDGTIVVTYSTPTSPEELYRVRAGGTLEPLTHVNTLPADLTVAETSVVHWSDGSGHTLVGQLTKSDTPNAPLITEVHGGPQCADDSSFKPEVQYFATNGYAYLRPSPRGSDGYGDWSYKAIVNDWGAGPMKDVMRGVDAVVASLHPSQLFLYGASYGGYLTTWTVGHSDRFHAAVAAIPVTDLTLDYTLTQSPNITRRFFGKSPIVDNMRNLDDESPIRYAADVHTPLLLVAGLRDVQAPYPQTIEYYKILHERGLDVKLLAYPNAGHGPDDPLGNLDWDEHIAGWFAAHGGLHLPQEILP